MTWFGWLLIAWWLLATLLTVGQVGKPRKPTEPVTAVVMVIVAALLCAGVLIVGTGRGL